MLSIFSATILVVYNVQLYNQEYRSIERSLTQAVNFRRFDDREKIEPPENKENPESIPVSPMPSFDSDELSSIRFMDKTVYTVLLDENDEISEVINQSNNDITDEEIQEIAVRMISQSFLKGIDNLYIADYSYSYIPRNSIVIVDNSSANQTLRSALHYSAIILVLTELIIFLFARGISRKITKPVQESFDKQKQFVADASHELKTPLAVIMASSDALENNPTETKWLNNIKTEADRMNKLISDLLELAKSDEIKDAVELEKVNLSKLVETSVLPFEAVMFEKNIKLTDSIEPDIELEVNSFKIKQLITILLDNAIQHSVENGEIRVELKADRDITLAVTNKGEGIAKGDEEKIFDRFYRSDESRNRNDNRYGLGLAIAKNIAEAHNASISASSNDGYTTFTVVFKK
jgi:signal transduction histidine kinase